MRYRNLSLSNVARTATFFMITTIGMVFAAPVRAAEETPPAKAMNFFDRLFAGEDSKLVWSILIFLAAFVLMMTMAKKQAKIQVNLLVAFIFGVATWVIYSLAIQGERDVFFKKATNIDHTVNVIQNNNAWLLALFAPPLVVLLLLWKAISKKIIVWIAVLTALLLANYSIVEWVDYTPN